ncbi:ABC transporter substrate-binding protein [Sporomusa sphaeroides]|uniref:Leucine-, isoleucine-, valine-, threonine-, and alanine-binding protein n=2 Tax=Sporomusa TaxID=2375 RepID=A0ABM9W272_9FIRM|nr:ABC transporter substrate-binding protein [Sporomusa sphaeroides]OLS57469.1 leucine-, isoleucine-, valine-, threonine-, and alanine-binding protein precursor [Sporomusa sphaeroides DSM 2875]CVK17967.1 Leucine-, isoleucine-, valine-, threonine-, and alanine-binding protein precursor [Sporomusa sphaeroides DSM 2875]SCM81192.1 Leucine-, isoleucine-, valine-, threonine-, and alanine-binding protein [uncultured Sporomusa sp.]
MRKKMLAVAMSTLMMAGALAGCGGGAKQEAANEIKLGGNFELTGGVANYGKQAVNGIQLAIKEANASGGVLGKQIKLVLADNKSEAAEATNALTKLITQDKVVAVFGPATSSNTIATVQVSQDNKIPIITPTGTSEKITVDNGKTRPYAFRSCFIDPLQGTIMANFASNTLKVKTAVMYIDNSSDYSKGLAKSFETVFTQNGGTILGQEAFLQKDQDFKSTLTKIKALNPEVVFIPAYYEEVGKILKQAREMGMNMPFIGTDGWDDAKVVEIAGAASLNNTYFSSHFSSQDTDPNVVKFIAAYKKEYNQEPSVFSALGYDAGLLMIDAIKRANSTDPQKIRDAIEQTKDLQLSTGIVTIDANHNPIKSAVVIEMKDGKQVFKEKITPKQ